MPVLTWLTASIASVVLDRLFFTLPDLKLDPGKVQAFEHIFQAACQDGAGRNLDYDCEYPKSEFLRYLVAHKPVLLHGSNSQSIETLLPNQQTDYNGRRMTAVFATGDGVWPIFFAVLDQASYSGSLRNGCFVVTDHKGAERRFYFFSINAEMRRRRPWTDGMVYVLPRGSFEPTSRGTLRFDEWASPDPVQPLVKLPVSPSDFPFLHAVTGHDEGESIYVSWWRFKKRQNHNRAGVETGL
jgi:hypothetical protein